MSTLIINFATEIQIEPLFKFFINFDFWNKNGHLTHCERRLQDDVPMTVLPSSRRANYQQECSFLICISSFCLSRINLPGRYYELNVHFGIFVGGMGNFNEIFLGNRENFRGCLDSVFFNGRDVLSQSKVFYIFS